MASCPQSPCFQGKKVCWVSRELNVKKIPNDLYLFIFSSHDEALRVLEDGSENGKEVDSIRCVAPSGCC